MKRNELNCFLDGTITIKVYKEPITNSPLFYIQQDNDNLENVVDIIEDTLKLY